MRGAVPEALIRVIPGAHERGVTPIDTAAAHGHATNEELVGDALAPVRDQALIAARFGSNIDPATASCWVTSACA